MLNEKITQLTEALRPHFTGNRSRIECMAAIILGLLSAGTVNLSTISDFVKCSLLHESMYKRIQGFFTEFALCLDEVAAFVLFIIPMSGTSVKNKHFCRHLKLNWKIFDLFFIFRLAISQ